MRSAFRRTALALAAVATLLWCSCERHHASELQPAQDTAHAEGKKPAEHGAKANAHASPAATRTPAQFFPTSTPSPH